VLGAKQFVEAMLGRGERLWEGHAEPAKPRGAGRDEQGLGRLEAASEVANPFMDELLAG
jgi:hypothetical protein